MEFQAQDSLITTGLRVQKIKKGELSSTPSVLGSAGRTVYSRCPNRRGISFLRRLLTETADPGVVASAAVRFVDDSDAGVPLVADCRRGKMHSSRLSGEKQERSDSQELNVLTSDGHAPKGCEENPSWTVLHAVGDLNGCCKAAGRSAGKETGDGVTASCDAADTADIGTEPSRPPRMLAPQATGDRMEVVSLEQ
jgi:hypothetical protein